jgi:hypothetical protein
MKKIICLFAIFQISLILFAQDFVGISYLRRTFNIKNGNESGTAFLVMYKGKDYLVTAKHLFKVHDSLFSIEVSQNDKWHPMQGKLFFHSNPSVDIAVLTSISWDKAGGAIRLDTSDINEYLGDQGFFLGFPYGFQTKDASGKLNSGFPIPLVKRATFSGSIIDDGVVILLFDGFNNPGFSGGPLLLKNRGNQGDKRFYVAGVISGYVNQINSLLLFHSKDTLALNYVENSGIIRVVDARYIKEIIDKILF